MNLTQGYATAARHPWPSAVLVLLLLAGYEAGLWWQTQAGTAAARAGLDSWIEHGLQRASWNYPAMPPILVAGAILFWLALAWRKPAPPLGTTCMGILLEGVAWAMLLWGLGAALTPVLEQPALALSPGKPNLSVLAWCVTFLGAGIYEETVFRLVLFGLLVKAGTAGLGAGWGTALAAAISVGLFAAAHHVGPHGEPWVRSVFAFRAVAGLVFTMLFHYRGFGVAVACHACYDVLVGVAARG